MAFKLFLCFIVSFFLHLPSRIAPLGVIRFDLLLVLATLVAIFMQSDRPESGPTETDRWLLVLFLYILFTVPFVRWPGSVVGAGIPNLIKAVAFYYFTFYTLRTTKHVKSFIAVFLACQMFRVMEPLYLHITDGYWGSAAFMGDGEFMSRLSGAPYDVINPNGLAFVIASIIPFLHFLWGTGSALLRVLYIGALPALLYAMVLTGSRSGMIAIGVIFLGIIVKSQHKIMLSLVIMLCGIVAFQTMDEGQKDRYTSIFSHESRHAQTAEGRTDAWNDDFGVALETPFIGHGLGTSKEANFHGLGKPQPAHNLVLEVWQEIGFLGLVIYMLFLKSIVVNFITASKLLQAEAEGTGYLASLTKALQVWLFMNIIFSFASYGLSSYEWYLFGGLSVVVARLAKSTPEDAMGGTVQGGKQN